MRKMSKLVCGLLALVMCFSLFGCNMDNDKNTIYVLCTKPEYTDYYKWLNAEFTKEYPDIKVELTNATTSDFNSAFTARLQSGKLSVFTMSSDAMLQGMYEYMADISDLNFWDKYDKRFEKQCGFYDEKQDKVIKLSAMLDTVGCVVYYNKKIFTEYNLELPKTYADFIKLCEDIKTISNNAVSMMGKTKIAKNAPILMGGKDQWPIFTLSEQIQSQVVQGKYPNMYDNFRNANYNTPEELLALGDEYRYNSPEWIETLTKTKEISNYFQPAYAGLSYDAAPRYFAKGNGVTKEFYPMMIDGTWCYGDIMKKEPSFDVGMFILPTSNEIPAKMNFATKSGIALSVFKNAHNMEYAKKYVEFQMQDRIYERYITENKLPSLLTTVKQNDAAIGEFFNEEKYNIVKMHDAALIQYQPDFLAGEMMELVQGKISPKDLADDVQERLIEPTGFSKWVKNKNLRHYK